MNVQPSVYGKLKFTISNIPGYGGTHELNVRLTPQHSTALRFTIEEMELLHEVLDDFLTPHHNECQHWCGIPVCDVDCGDDSCETCAVDLHRPSSRF